MTRNLGRLFDNLLDMFETSEDPEEIRTAFEELYDEGVKRYGPAVGLISSLIGKVAKDLRPFMAGLLSTSIDHAKDEQLQELTLERNSLRASLRNKLFIQYVEAGFTRDEAMALLLQDIANFKAEVQQLGESLKRASSSSSSSSRER